ncbi:MAG: RHS repeat-associated core domain-containing protein [Mycobacteriales bacterium]
MRVRRSAVVPVASTLLLAALQVPLGPAPHAVAATVPAPPKSADVKVRPDEFSAAVAAQTLGHPVEVSSLRTPTTSIFINPDGTHELDSSSFLRNLPDARGMLQPIDPGVVQRPDGSWVTGLHPLRPRFAARASAQDVTIATAAGDIHYGLTGPLQSLAAKGGAADVIYHGVAPGVDANYEVLADTVKETLVVASPTASSAWTFSFDTPNLTASQLPDGTIAFRDAHGVVQATIPIGAAWDSAATPSTVPVKLTLQGTGPSVQVRVSVDPIWLASPDRVWPIQVDPSLSAAQGASTAYKSDGTVCASPTCTIRGGNSQSGVAGADTYWRSTEAFSYNAIFGKHVLGATFVESLKAGTANCYNHVWYTVNSESYGGYGSAVTANNNLCTSGTTAGTSTLVSTLQGWANTSNSGRRLFMRGQETSGLYTYKEINATLTITYNSYPNTAGTPSMAPVTGTGPSSYWTSTATPTLHATVSDPDGGNVRGLFEVYQGSTLVWSGYSGYVTSGGTASVAVPASANLANGPLYTIRVYGNDGTDDSKAWSNYIQFTVDTAPPGAPAITSSSYPAGLWTGASTASNNFSWTQPASDVTGYYYGLDSNPPTTWTTGTSVTWNPPGGWHTLYVEAVDRAGNRSSVASYSFGIGNGGLLSPKDRDRTQDSVTLLSQPPSGYTQVRYDWAPGTTTGFATIPAASITQPGGAAISPYSNGTYDTSQALTWKTINQAGTDGLLQLRACFAVSTTAAPDVCSVASSLQVVRTTFGASYATRSFGPGTLSLLTGDFSATATDASLATYGGSLSVSRTTTTLNPPGQAAGIAGVVGPGWTVSLPSPESGRTDQTLTDNSTNGNIVLTGPDGGQDTFAAVEALGTLPRHYTGVGDASDGTTLVENPAHTFTATDPDGTQTVWNSQGTSTPVAMSSVTQPGIGGPTYTYDPNTHLLSSVTGQAPVSCPTPSTVGCRSLQFYYSAPSSNAASLTEPAGMSDAAGQLAEIDAVVTDPATGAVTSTPVARYGYDGTAAGAHLVGEWDPRISPKLVSRYSYGGNGNRLASLTPPGLNPWTLGYDGSGRLITVTRHDSDLNQDAISTVVYSTPWNGTAATNLGLPDLSKNATSGWGESSDVVANATAIFGPDYPPPATPGSADWPHAQIAYLDVNGREVNTASYGAGAWQIDTTSYDQNGNVISQLSADNRNQALQPTTATDPTVAAMSNTADRASALSTLNTYSSDGTDLLESVGPEHQTLISDAGGGPAQFSARTHTQNTYDAGAPSGGPYHLVTSSTVSSQTPDLVNHDPHTTVTGYNALVSGDGDGWALRMPTSVTTVVPGGTNVTHWTRFDSSGRVIETRLPMGTADGTGAGNDARSTVTRYYLPGAAAPCSNAALGSTDPGVLYAGLVCQTGPPAGGQPTGSQPTLPTGTVNGYTMWQQPTTVEERDASGTLLRTSSTGYDAAGRPQTSSVVTTTAVTGGATSTAAVPTVTTSYDPGTGLPTTVSSSAGTLTTSYDSLGRPQSYTDAGGNQSVTTYDLAGRVATRSDGKATYTYTYDNGGGSTEHRGLLTSLNTGITAAGYTGATSYTASYDAAGRASTITLPNGDVASSTFDNAGEQTKLAYTGQGLGTSGLTFTATYDGIGRKVSSTGPASTQTFTYTPVGELASAVRNVSGACTSQAFGYNANSDRTGYASNGTCTAPTGTLPTVHTYDEADRLADAGVSYDQLGRTTSTPASTVTGGSAVSVGYFDNDMVQQQTQGTHTQTFTLDPSGHRIISQTDSVAGTSTNNYADGSDSPAWTSNPTGWTRNIAGLDGLGAIQTHTTSSGADAVALQLLDLSGSVVTTLDDTAGAIVNGISDYDPFGASAGGTPAPAKYGWLGGHQRAADDLGGLVLMGYRLYNPSTGRFLQTDPVAGGSANAYDYVYQDPINKFDLDGRCWGCGWFKKHWKAVATVVAIVCEICDAALAIYTAAHMAYSAYKGRWGDVAGDAVGLASFGAGRYISRGEARWADEAERLGGKARRLARHGKAFKHAARYEHAMDRAADYHVAGNVHTAFELTQAGREWAAD